MLKVAYFSPLNPLRSGISDYSEEILPYLAERISIDLYVDGYIPSNQALRKRFLISNIEQYRPDKYDLAVYHIGNNKHYHKNIYQQALKYPGVVVMHDLAIHHMIAAMTVGRGRREEYFKEMEYCHGEAGGQRARAFLEGAESPPWETDALEYPLNRRIIESARGVITHSYFIRNGIKQVWPTVPVKRIFHHSAEIVSDPEFSRREAKHKLGLAEGEPVLASFGFATPSKRINQIIAVLSRLYQEKYRFRYYVVGETAPEVDIDGMAKMSGLPRDCYRVTGYLGLDDFTCYMKAADICINLRYPVFGETSGSLHRLLGMGKAVFVTDCGSFSEYPEDVVIKIGVSPAEERQLYEALKELFHNPDARERLGRAAHRFARENLSPALSARSYTAFLEGLCGGSYLFTGLVEELADTLVELEIEENSSLVRSLSDVVAGLV